MTSKTVAKNVAVVAKAILAIVIAVLGQVSCIFSPCLLVLALNRNPQRRWMRFPTWAGPYACKRTYLILEHNCTMQTMVQTQNQTRQTQNSWSSCPC